MDKWISVEERLPNEEDIYLVHAPLMGAKKPFVGIGYYDADTSQWSIPLVWNAAVTHWMPLPEPPGENR